MVLYLEVSKDRYDLPVAERSCGLGRMTRRKDEAKRDI